MTKSLIDKSYLVFGGSSGIGRGAVETLLDAGAKVAVASADREALEKIAQIGSIARFLSTFADVRIDADVAAAVARTVAQFGGLDGVVYSAGIQRYGSVVDTPEAVWDDCLAVNLKGAYLVGKHAVPALIARGGGAIVHVSSVQAFANQSGVAAYAASKGGLNALTRAMAVDHARQGIRVNVVCPGSVDTPMLRESARAAGGPDAVESTLRGWGELHALGRIATPAEVGRVIAFLLSDAAAFITGTEVKVDGGLTAALPVRLRD